MKTRGKSLNEDRAIGVAIQQSLRGLEIELLVRCRDEKSAISGTPIFAKENGCCEYR